MTPVTFIARLLMSSVLVVHAQLHAPDWLVAPASAFAQPSFTENADGTYLLTNGLISRTFTFQPAFGTLDFYDVNHQQSLLRAISCEGLVSLDGVEYGLGAITPTGTPYHAYLNRSDTGIQVNPTGWNATGWSLSTPVAPFPWTPGTRGSPNTTAWPPLGLTLSVTLAAPASARPAHRAVSITLVYELYPGIPLLTKWMHVTAAAPAAVGVIVTAATPVSLRLTQPYTPRSFAPYPPSTLQVDSTSWLYVATDEAHGTAVSWDDDSALPDSPGAAEVCVSTTYVSGPGVVLGINNGTRLHKTRVGAGVAEFVSFRSFMLITGTTERERFGLSVRKLFRLWAPHATENPIFFHAVATDAAGWQQEVDQAAATGFEMIIYSFGSGFNLEDASPANVARVKAQITYAQSKGIEVGGYDLICLERGNGGYGGNVGDQWDTVETGGKLGQDACFASGWVDKLTEDAFTFINQTGLSMLETDGPYGGESCASTTHSGHVGLTDSVYQQTRTQADWYSGLRARDVYINQPDIYFFQGGQRAGIGYNEDQYSLPRWQDITITRMSIFEDTYRIMPTMGWRCDELCVCISSDWTPMSAHAQEYEMALAQNLLAGVAACYRGVRLYDTPAIAALVSKYVAIYKAYRQIIISDIIHVSRPDGQGIDSFLHANPALSTCGFAVAFNPTNSARTQNISWPLYYTGLTTSVLFAQEGVAPAAALQLSRDYNVILQVTLPAKSVTWWALSAPAAA